MEYLNGKCNLVGWKIAYHDVPVTPTVFFFFLQIVSTYDLHLHAITAITQSKLVHQYGGGSVMTSCENDL